MNCPRCRIASFRKVMSGSVEIDRCDACGAFWFDPGEIRELVEGRLTVESDGPAGEGAPPRPGDLPVPKERRGAFFAGMCREAARLSCPRCGGPLKAVDYQMTGVPVFRCAACGGILAPQAAALGEKFRHFREYAPLYAAMGEQLAKAEAARFEEEARPFFRRRGGLGLPVPVVVPLSDDGPEVSSLPVVTWILMALTALPYILRLVFDVPEASLLPGGKNGLPSGTGFGGVSAWTLPVVLFVHAGIVPLARDLLFLFVLGDNVEDRMGRVPFAGFYLLCGVLSGAAHVVWGTAGGPPALGSAGAAAGILGAYLVFFPNVSVKMYGLGRIVSIPAYLFACAWVVGIFLFATGPDRLMDWLMGFLNPAPLSLAGSLVGFGAGIGGALLWRSLEESVPPADALSGR
jgi:membrane associated rhomboid family serine protease